MTDINKDGYASWGAGGLSGEAKPNWLTEEERKRTIADDTGWVLVHPDGTRETLVAIEGLADKLDKEVEQGTTTVTTNANGVVSAIRLAKAKGAHSTAVDMIVNFNEPVRVSATGIVLEKIIKHTDGTAVNGTFKNYVKLGTKTSAGVVTNAKKPSVVTTEAVNDLVSSITFTVTPSKAGTWTVQTQDSNAKFTSGKLSPTPDDWKANDVANPLTFVAS